MTGACLGVAVMLIRSVDLEPGVAKTYAAVIDDILAGSNLTTISAKAIRRGLQERGYDIAEHKVCLHLHLPGAAAGLDGRMTD